MTLGLHEERSRRRRQRRWGLFRFVLFVAAIAVAAGFAYEAGRVIGTREAGAMREELAELRERFQEVEAQRGELERALAQAEEGRAAAEARYTRDVPSGAAGKILSLGREKLDSGIAEDRLLTLLSLVKPERDCSNEPVTKRFLVTTPLASGQNNSVAFAKGLVTVTAVGESALSANGKPEAWFDPGLPVAVKFTDLNGEVTEANGRLPLNQSVVVGDREYRFTVAVGKRGFVEVSGDSCRFP